MVKPKRQYPHRPHFLEKTKTGIAGLDEITLGGVPQGRPTLVVGASGCGKTLLAAEFLARGALEYDESGVFISFEESAKEIIKNTASLGFDLASMIAKNKLIIDEVRIDPEELREAGEYNLEGLFIRLNNAIDTTGAKRVVIDTIETLFSNLTNQALLRAELNRLDNRIVEQICTRRMQDLSDTEPVLVGLDLKLNAKPKKRSTKK